MKRPLQRKAAANRAASCEKHACTHSLVTAGKAYRSVLTDL